MNLFEHELKMMFDDKVKTGPITTLNVTQTIDGKLKLIISEAEATDGEIMKIGNTQTPARFKYDPDTYMEKWFNEYPTHHCALAVGHNASVLKKVGQLLDINTVSVFHKNCGGAEQLWQS